MLTFEPSPDSLKETVSVPSLPRLAVALLKCGLSANARPLRATTAATNPIDDVRIGASLLHERASRDPRRSATHARKKALSRRHRRGEVHLQSVTLGSERDHVAQIRSGE